MQRINALIFLLIMASFAFSMQDDSPQTRLNQKIKDAKASVTHVSPADLLKKIETDTSFVLIDVREQDEWDAGHISGAIHIPRGKIEFGISAVIKDIDHDVVLYCRSGGRSALAAQSLLDLGYTGVKDLDGGIKAWAAAGYSFYNSQGEITFVKQGAVDPRQAK